MTGRNYLVYDVFTETVLAGNPLAIVLDAQGLDTTAMQSIAREFNLSETVFVLPPEEPSHRARIRIFTPALELPFAGHPTVGTAIALAARDGTETFVLEENIGPVYCTVSQGDAGSSAIFTLPRLAERVFFDPMLERIADALGLSVGDIGFDNHRLGVWSAGVPYMTVPVRGLEVAGRARMDVHAWPKLAPHFNGMIAAPYVYCRESVNGADFHARMFAGFDGIEEDPATGSAVAALTGAINTYDQLAEGTVQLSIEQGVEMGRPSWIRLELDIAAGNIKAARIGGGAVRVAAGVLFA
ncbi:PhzF family phenazine biosynthesis isomerase [Mesorhizobium sp. NBSH29]|uniref:PhzF family phenazine biosynthesis protein n=1 Tax=Mesorhizobium sp. NBSH29 TaxID=2654249 RepID=UPI0018966506|nr:PhzF family phenazine biosynthesis protein [Mesorhizobium sp. NBSH29]QPC88134.1 PhzF family phenazine biosynthesis isomerase [Mesorhizobium sp. NBSH29]